MRRHISRWVQLEPLFADFRRVLTRNRCESSQGWHKESPAKTLKTGLEGNAWIALIVLPNLPRLSV